MKKSKISILLLAMVMILAISAASAADIDDTSDSDVLSVEETTVDEVVSTDAVDEVATANNDAEVLSADGDGNFTELQTSVNTGMVMMDKDYARVEGENDISITKDVTILGNNHKIDANNLGGIFRINSGYTLTLIGVTLINGNSEYGGAIYNDGGSATIVNSYFLNNTAEKSGGAIYNNAGSMSITGSTFDGNDLTDRTVNGYGGAAIYSNGGTILLSGATVTNNLKDIVHRGGTGQYTGDLSSAAVSSTGSLTVSDSYFEKNSGSYGGAILSNGENAILRVVGSTFVDNFAFNGGAIDFVGNVYTISNCTFRDNKARGSGSTTSNYANGGAICAQESNGDSVIVDCIFENNSGVIGGAISSTDSKVTRCTFINNTAQASYSETFNGKPNNRGGFGSAIYSTENIVIEDSEFKDNLNTRKDCVHIQNAEITGSSFENTVINLNNKGTLTVANNTYDNDAKDIAGVSTSNVYIGEGQVPKVTSGNVYSQAATFTDLQAMVDSGTTSTIYLSNDITKLESEYDAFADGVIISGNVIINSNGYTITSNSGKVFTVNEGNTLTLRGADIVGDGTSAIDNNGQVTLGKDYTYTFTNVGEYAIDNKGTVYEASLTNFTQLADLIALVNGGDVYIGSSKITKSDKEKEAFADGIIIENDLTIRGFANTNGILSYIDAANSGRIFSVNDGATLTVDTLVLKNGNAEKGGAIYVESANALVVKNAELINNTATYRGGAIYSEGTVTVNNVKLDGNDITFRTKNDDNGGAAIYNLNGVLIIIDSTITNNLKDIVIRNGNAGDLLVGVVVTSGETVIKGSYFANNTGSWGGAISSLGYLNTEDYTVTVMDSKFEGNNATFGGAIYVESSELVIDNCTFENNKGVGVGSSGTSNTQGGAIVIHPAGASATITDSTFIANSANTGGAVSLAGVDGDSIIENCTFTDNTASDGGAVYLWTQDTAVVTVANSTFSGNTANWGNAISTDGALALSNNTISSTSADIGNWGGSITSYINATILGNDTVSADDADVKLTATIVDDNGNVIMDHVFNFIVNGVEVPATFNYGTNLYEADYTLPRLDTYVVGMVSEDTEVDVYKGTISYIKGTFTELQNIIDNDEFGLIFLPYDFKYDEVVDGDKFTDGIVINKNLYIIGNDYTIDANNSARIFNVTNGAIFKIDDATLTNGRADYGGAIYVDADSFLNTQYVVLYNNTATYRGGAIYSEGTVDVMDSVLDGNDITFRTKNDDNGGAAIYNLKGDLSILNSNITNNLKDIVIRNGSAGDLLVGVVVTSGYTFIEDSYFANNTGSWGGAISSLGYMNDESYLLSVKNTKFEGNNATFGGAIFVESSKLEVDNCTFENNKGVGVGSSGTSNTQGGAIIVHPAQSSVSITDSTFTGNSANVGAAVSLSRVDGDSIIENCTFTDNTASSEGGAIYGYTVGKLTVANSTFSGNTAPWGNAISNDGILVLSNNTVSGSSPDIANYYGTIESEMNIVILNNETVTFTGETLITAKVTDDNNNIIMDINFVFVVNETELDAKFNSTSGLYQAVYENDNAGFYVVNITYNEEENLVVKTGTLKNIKGTFTDLQNKVNAADDELSLSYNFTFVEGIDDALINGIVIDKAITIDGNGSTISGADVARILQLNANGITIDNVTFTNGYADMDSTSSADWGGAIYSNGAYTNHIISNSRFYNNTAYNGGAIYLAGDDSKIINSTFEDNTANASGGAVFLFGWDCTIEGSNFTDNTANQLGGAVAMYSSHPAIIRESSFISNYAGQNGGAVSWQRATGSIFDSTFIENEAGANGGAVFWDANSGSVAGGEFTGNIANGFGGAIFVNDNAGLTVASTFTENAALNGGAIAAYGDTTVYTSTFTENTADNYGGAIFVNDGAELDIKQSTIKDNTATVGNSIYVMDGTIDSTIINATILDNKTWDDTDLGDIYILNATLTDDNGNMIYDPSFRFTVDGTVIEDVPLYDDETGLYTIPYYIGTAGSKVVSTNYDAENLEIFTGILDIPKANITEFTVLTIDALEGENATIWINLIGVNDKGLNSTVTVIVNNKEYAVPVENGEGNLTIEGLTHGQYPVVAMFDDPNYNPAINSSVFFVKGKSVLNITELTVAEYGDVIEIAINLTGSDGKPLTGVVVVDDVINVLVENGIGTFVIDNQPDVGNYTFQAVYDGDNDYFGDLAIFNVTINTKVIDPEDIVVDIPNINEFGEAIPITITSPVDGIYTVNINGTPVEVEVVNGTGSVEITLDNPGIYNATVDIADEGYSLETITTDEFEYLVTPEFNVVITGTYPEAEISITGPAGTYHVIIDGMEPVDITREESGLPTTKTIDMDAGNYTAFVTFDARDEYYGDYKEINFTVNKAALDIAEPEVIGDKVVESPINITFTLPADVDPSSVTAFMDGVPVPIDEFVINETTGVYTLPLDGFSVTGGHLFTVQVNDPNYEEDGAQVSFLVEKVKTDVTIKVDESEIGVMGSPIVNITVSNNATGYIVIDNDGTVSVVEITNGTYSYQITDLTAGDYYINVTFLENDKYLKSNASVEFNVSKSAATPEIIDVTSSILGGQDATFKVDMNNDFATGNVTIYVDDKEYATVILDDDYANATVVIKGLTSGPHSIGVKYNGNDNFEESDVVPVDITVTKADSKVTIDPIEDALFELPITITYNIENETEITVSIKDENGTEISETFTVEDGKIIVRPLDVGKYTIVIENIGNDMFNGNSASQGFNVVENPNFSYDVGLPDNTTTDTTFTINVPKDATGYLLVDIDGKHYYAPVENGTASVTVSGLAPGNYTANITYTGDDRYPGITATDDVSVPSNVPENALTIPETSETTSPTYSINLPSDATGYLVVDVDGTKYAAALVNGSASVTVPGLAEGNHNVTVTYTGDGKYSSVSKNTTLNVHVPVYNITNNKNIKMLYTAKSPYKVLVTKDGKAVGAGEVVTFKFNGKTYKVKTDANGYATLKIPNVKPKKATYPITATYKGVTVKNTVKVNNIIKAKNKKVKKSKKVTKVKVSLKKVNKKYLKKKTLKVKFRGKIYKVKTNKKGVATWKVKKSMLKKLKVGKKYKYKVTYGKNTLTKKLTIKR